MWWSNVQIELEFGVLVFVEGGKPEYPEKNPRCRDENQQQTQSTCDAGSGSRTHATMVGGEYSHDYTIPAPFIFYVIYYMAFGEMYPSTEFDSSCLLAELAI